MQDEKSTCGIRRVRKLPLGLVSVSPESCTMYSAAGSAQEGRARRGYPRGVTIVHISLHTYQGLLECDKYAGSSHVCNEHACNKAVQARIKQGLLQNDLIVLC